MLASAGEGADGVAGLGARLTPRGSGFAPLMLKSQSGMNHHKESSYGGGVGGGRRKEKRMEGEEEGEEGGEEGEGNDGDPRGYRGQRLDTEYRGASRAKPWGFKAPSLSIPLFTHITVNKVSEPG